MAENFSGEEKATFPPPKGSRLSYFRRLRNTLCTVYDSFEAPALGTEDQPPSIPFPNLTQSNVLLFRAAQSSPDVIARRASVGIGAANLLYWAQPFMEKRR